MASISASGCNRPDANVTIERSTAGSKYEHVTISSDVCRNPRAGDVIVILRATADTPGTATGCHAVAIATVGSSGTTDANGSACGFHVDRGTG
jgi:hypothetical protein